VKRRLAAVAVVVMAAGGATAVAYRLPPGQAGPLTGRVTLAVTGVSAVPVCPGPEALVVPAGGAPVEPAAAVVVVGAVATGGTGPATDRWTLGGVPLSTVGHGIGLLTLSRTAAGMVALQGPGGAPTPTLSSVQLSLARTGDLRGLVAVACSAATSQSWLVGGGTQSGRRDVLLLANPAATPAVVDVTVLGPKGPVPAPAGTGVVLAAGQQSALLIDALAPGLDALAVHVQARTGRVLATLHDAYLRGLTPGGVDDVTAAAPAATQQVVPGLSVVSSGSSMARRADAPGAVAVRVVNPGTTEAVVRVRLLGDGGEIELSGGVLTVPTGAVADIPVTGVPPGTYAAMVDSDVPVLAGALLGRTSPGGQAAGTPGAVAGAVPPSELAWAASVQPLSAESAVALPAAQAIPTAVGALLSLAAPAGAGAVQVTEIGRDGRILASVMVQVPAGATAEHSVSTAAAAILLRPATGSGPVAAAVVLQAADRSGPMVSVIPVRSGQASQPTRSVLVADARVGLG
jgi:hypothetical protein